MTDLPLKPRAPIEALIRVGDTRALLQKAGELHGHFCPFLALGVRAGVIALRALGVQDNPGMEDVVAIMECNNCFSDGIQMVTGCTFGNNALIYRDVGKTAVTLAKQDGTAVRVVLRADFVESFREHLPAEADALFREIIQERQEATPEQQARLMELWAEAAFRQLAICGESLLETRARVKDGRAVCIPCAEAEYYQLTGDGISLEK